MNFNVVFYGLNKLYFAASVYAEEHNIFHSAHLVSQGEERPQPNLTSGVIIFLSPPLFSPSLYSGHTEVKYWKALGDEGVFDAVGVMGVAHMCCDDPWRAVQRRMPDNGIHNSEEVIFQHLCQYINISVQSLAELYSDSEPGAFNQRAAVNVSLRLRYLNNRSNLIEISGVKY